MPSSPLVEHIYRGPIHERIERHNRLLLDANCYRGFAVICCGTRVAHYLALHPDGIKRVCCAKMLEATPTRDESGVWIRDELHAHIDRKHRATELMLKHTDSSLWRFTRIVVVGDTDCVAFDFPTVCGV